MQITFRDIGGPVPHAYLGMTFALYGPLLRNRDARSPFIAIGVEADGAPAGFGLAKTPEIGGHGEALSLFIRPELWTRGLGTLLLSKLEEALLARGCAAARLTFSTQSKSVNAVARILQKRGWSPPRVHSILAEIDGAAVTAPWVARISVHPPFSVFPWKDLTESERLSLEGARPSVPSALWPFDADAPIDPDCSLGLRFGSEVAGWMIVHLLGPLKIRLTALYVRLPWQRTEISMGLLAESLRRIGQHHGPSVVGSLAVHAENGPMLKVFKRRFSRYARAQHELRIAEKPLAGFGPT